MNTTKRDSFFLCMGTIRGCQSDHRLVSIKKSLTNGCLTMGQRSFPFIYMSMILTVDNIGKEKSIFIRPSLREKKSFH